MHFNVSVFFFNDVPICPVWYMITNKWKGKLTWNYWNLSMSIFIHIQNKYICKAEKG